ncbi:hypothetical protein AALP_AA6G299300 [Arabis alpina]|uniref:Uncharacterized protein n=1 Tax=Arabis alpina TaxID=50452 RepID=A0A087GSM8_ARAAL|nr:hypothetical protein AALP_AA6G299300 [Arabis alpina]
MMLLPAHDFSDLPELVPLGANNFTLQLVFVFRTPSQPPESCYGSVSWRKFIAMVCVWLLCSLSTLKDYGTFPVNDDVAVWKILESRYVHRKGEIWLGSVKQNMEFIIDRRWSGFWIDKHVLSLAHSVLKLYFPERNEDSLILVYHPCEFIVFSRVIKTSEGCYATSLVYVAQRLFVLDNSHNFRELLGAFLVSKSIKHGFQEPNSLIQLLQMFFANYCFLSACFYSTKFHDMVYFWRSRHKFQRHTRLFRKLVITYDQCYFLIICVCYARVNSHSSKHMRRIARTIQFYDVIWFVLLLSRLHKDEYHILVCFIMLLLWLDFHESIASPRYSPRQGEFFTVHQQLKFKMYAFSVLQYFLCLKVAITACDLYFSERKCAFELMEDFGFVNCKSVTYLVSWFCISFDDSSYFLKKIMSRLVIVGCGRAKIYIDAVFATQELLWKQSLSHPHLRSSFIHLPSMWNQALFCLCQECVCGVVTCCLQWYKLLMQERLHMVLMHKQSQVCGFFRFIHVAYSGRLRLLLNFPYGAAPRPPEAPISVLKLSNSHGVQKHMELLCPRWNTSILRGSIRGYI